MNERASPHTAPPDGGHRGGARPSARDVPAELSIAIETAAVAIARQAGEALLAYYAGPLQVRFKSKQDADPVTEADVAIEALVRREVAARFPDHGVVGEEGADPLTLPPVLWVVDPLDGTANFANALPIFAVSIGVLYRGEPLAAALFTTFGPDGRACVLHARAGGGLKLDGKAYAPRERTLSHRARLAGVPAGFHKTFAMWRLRGKLPGETRSLGSTAAELGLVATGTLQYAVFASPRIWDVAAGVLLVSESGGAVFTDQRRRWQHLSRFEPPPGKPLREWKQAVIAGDARLLYKTVGKVRVRRSPAERARALLGPTWWSRLGRPVLLGRRAAAVASRWLPWTRRVVRRRRA